MFLFIVDYLLLFRGYMGGQGEFPLEVDILPPTGRKLELGERDKI